MKSFSNLKQSKAFVGELKLQVENAARQLDFAAIESEHKNDIAATESEYKNDIAAIESKLQDDISEIDLQMTAIIWILNTRRDAEDFAEVNVMLDAATLKITGTSLLSDQNIA